MKDPVLIKSNKYGITVFFQHELPFEQLMEETLEKFRSAKHFFNHAEMVVEFEGRAFTEEETLRMADAIQTAADIQILCLLERDTRTEEIHKQAYHESLQVIHERDGLFYKGTLREKHRLEAETSIVIIGDVEDGAIVTSKGNVTVLGTIRGIVTAGAAGRRDAWIAALHLGLRNLDVVMGLENLIVYNLVDVIEGTCRLKQALIRDKRYENLYLLPSAQTRDKTAISPGQMKKLTSELREEFDYILLDCPAGIEQGFQNAIAGADRAIVVTTPEVSAIRDADRIIGLLENQQIKKIELIINRIRMDMVRRGDMMSVDDVTEILSVPLIGALPDDEKVVIGTNQGEPVIGLGGEAASAYLNICKRILGLEVPFLDLNTGNGFFSRLSSLFKKD